MPIGQADKMMLYICTSKTVNVNVPSECVEKELNVCICQWAIVIRVSIHPFIWGRVTVAAGQAGRTKQ